MEKTELCEVTELHEGLLRQVRDTLPDETALMDLADLFKVFGDTTRVSWRRP